jgi:hypothetical protein
MKTIIRPRQSGKTTDLIRLSASLPYCNYIVVSTYERARFVAKQADQLGLNIAFPITAVELLRGEFSRANIKGFLFDDADDLLCSLCKGVPIVAVTITDECDNDPRLPNREDR